MKRFSLMITVLFFCLGTTAQESVTIKSVTTDVESFPEHMYCEIIGYREILPSYLRFSVIFDFGQTTPAWKYNWIKDKEGKNIKFNSMIEALNYMVT